MSSPFPRLSQCHTLIKETFPTLAAFWSVGAVQQLQINTEWRQLRGKSLLLALIGIECWKMKDSGVVVAGFCKFEAY